MSKLHDRIKALRQAAGMTQSELAEHMGYTDRSAVAHIESGRVDIPQSKIAQFAEVLHTTPAYLMGWDDDPEDYDQAEELDSLPGEWLSHFNGDTRQAVRAYRAMEQDRAQEASSRPTITQEVEKLLAAWRRADRVYKRVALELLESHPAEQENHTAFGGMAT